MLKTIFLPCALALGLSSCAAGGMLATAGGPVEAIVASEVGYDSYFMQGLQYVGDATCGLGDGSGNWSPDDGGTCIE